MFVSAYPVSFTPAKTLIASESFAGSTILKVVYGYTAREGKDSFIEKVDESMAQFSELLKFGTYFVDFFPCLRFVPEWFPGGGWKKTLRHHRQTMQEMSTIPFEMVKERMVYFRLPLNFKAIIHWLSEERHCSSLLYH